MAPQTVLKRLKPVLVEWLDILDGGPEWHENELPLNPVRVKTIGYLWSEGRKHIVVVRDYYDLDGKRTLGGRLAIPKGCIQKLVPLEPKSV
jgi:hypothetical protein